MALRKPQTPPTLAQLMTEFGQTETMTRIFGTKLPPSEPQGYLHWDELRHRPPPKGLTSREWWFALKVQRFGQRCLVPLKDKGRHFFSFTLPDLVQKELHHIDCGAGAALSLPDPITNPQTRDQYLVRSLMEEAITSSQLEGAVTTREVAKDMIRTGRMPRDRSERMILNNYRTMQRIVEVKDREMTKDLLLELHRLVTDGVLDNPAMAGRFRGMGQKVVVDDLEGEVYHEPPPAEELETRCGMMCDFANGKLPGFFIHPVVRAILLHFWLAYDHPFVDGNGRTARALFYWAMLHSGLWLFEFISISTILRRAPVQYARSFLYAETDENDLTYFLVAQTEVIRKAIDELHAYIDRKTAENQEMGARLKALRAFNHRQSDLLRHALKHPSQEYTIASHQVSHQVVYQTARTDLLELQRKELLTMTKRGKTMVFAAPRDLADRLRKLDQEVSP